MEFLNTPTSLRGFDYLLKQYGDQAGITRETIGKFGIRYRHKINPGLMGTWIPAREARQLL